MKKLSTNNEPSWAGYKLFEFVKNEFESLVDLLSCPRGFIAFKGEHKKDREVASASFTTLLSLAGKAVEKLHRFLSRLFFKAKLDNLLEIMFRINGGNPFILREVSSGLTRQKDSFLSRSNLASFISKTNKYQERF